MKVSVKKLLITGGGRCNITNAEFDIRVLLSKYKEASPFLFSPFTAFGVKESLDFFLSKGLETKIENEKRAFPITNRAQSVWNVLVNNLKENKVEILSNSPVKKLVKEDRIIKELILENGEKIQSKKFIIATGGTSRPEMGSTGDGFMWLKDLGHKVLESDASLVPISIKDSWVKKLSGVTLKDIKLSLFQDEEKQRVEKGKVLFTHFGISGPTVLNMSKDIGELLKYGEVFIELDLLPKENYGTLNEKLQELCKTENKKMIKNSLGVLIPSALVEIVLEKSKVLGDTFNNSLTREARISLVQNIKHLKMEVVGLLGKDRAVVSSGGVDLLEVDFKTMRSRLFSNLYIVGDVLNIDRPSGGYSLQLCWTTGFVAGKDASIDLNK
ncbi:MAG: aminoacetone oxidase family FAD-binding enzyme [Candidatus Paceibacterota bacterium]